MPVRWFPAGLPGGRRIDRIKVFDNRGGYHNARALRVYGDTAGQYREFNIRPLPPLPAPPPPPEPDEWGSRALQDWAGMNPNADRGMRPADSLYSNASGEFEALLASEMPASYIGIVRESLNNSLSKTTKPSASTWNNAWLPGGNLEWAVNMCDLYLAQGRKVWAQPLVDSQDRGTDYSEGTWGDAIRWYVYNIAKGLDGKIMGKLHSNECDNLDMFYLPYVRDFGSTTSTVYDGMDPADVAAKTSATAVAAALDRIILCAKMMWEELISGPRVYAPGAYPLIIAGPTNAFASATQSNSLQVWMLRDLLTRQSGAYLNYVHAISSHFHHVQTRIPTFSGTPPANNVMSPHHMWTALQEGQALNNKLMPIITTETGVGYSVGSLPNGSYDPETARAYRFGMTVCMMHWYAISLWTAYSLALSGAGSGQNLFDGGAGVPFAARASWPTLKALLDYRQYDVAQFQQGSFPAKAWQEFHLPASWAVYFAQNQTPAGSSGNPWAEWGRVTMAGGQVTCASGGRNLLMRPLALRSTDQHVFRVEGKVSGSGQIRAHVRGHDKLNGLLQAVDPGKASGISSSSAWTEFAVPFTPQQHGVVGLTDPCTALLCIDHNGTGTAEWRNPRIERVT